MFTADICTIGQGLPFFKCRQPAPSGRGLLAAVRQQRERYARSPVDAERRLWYIQRPFSWQRFFPFSQPLQRIPP